MIIIMKKLYTNKSIEFLIDDDDYTQIKDLNWYGSVNSRGKKYITGYDKVEKRLFYLHRLLLGVFDNRQVDHINGNSLDNRKSNLRICNISQNCQNKNKSKNKYKGIQRRTANRWRACIVSNNVKFYLGNYNSEREAALAYNEKAKELFGEFACLNNV